MRRNPILPAAAGEHHALCRMDVYHARLIHAWVLRCRYSDGDQEDLDWGEFDAIRIRDTEMALGSTCRRKSKRPARFNGDRL